MSDVKKANPKAQAPKAAAAPAAAAKGKAPAAATAKAAAPKKSAAAKTAAAAKRPHWIAKGLSRFSASKRFHQSYRYHFVNKGGPKKASTVKAPVVKPIKGAKNGATRTILPKRSAYYPTEDIARPLPSNKGHHKPQPLRANIRPGQVLIVLSGPFRGKRVVFLKQLPSGLLLITGPFKINGVPLRRINQAYVLATSTTVDVSKVDVKNKLLIDQTFARPKKAVEKKSEEQYFNEAASKKASVAPERVALQVAIDRPLLDTVTATPDMKAYLAARFSLKHGQYPHMKQF